MPYTSPCTLARLCRLTAATAFALTVNCASAASQWSIHDLGTLPGGTFTTGSAVNDRGQVVGSGDLVPRFNETGERVDTPFAFISAPNGGALTLVDTGPEDAFLSSFDPAAVTIDGRIVGTALQGSSFPYAFVTGPNGTALDFATGDPLSSGFANGIDINNSGEVLIQNLPGGVRVAKPDGSIVEVRSDSDTGAARAINDAGQVALNAQPDPLSAQVNGFIWSQAEGFQFVRADGVFSEVYDINNAGQALAAGADGIFIADAGGVTLNFLDLPDGSAIDNSMGLPKFNDSGQVIGRLRAADGSSFSFVTGANGNGFFNIEILPDIMLAGLSSITLTGINNLGQLAGTGMINGQQRALFLAPVPEPQTYALMLSGLGMLVYMQTRRRKNLRQ